MKLGFTKRERIVVGVILTCALLLHAWSIWSYRHVDVLRLGAFNAHWQLGLASGYGMLSLELTLDKHSGPDPNAGWHRYDAYEGWENFPHTRHLNVFGIDSPPGEFLQQLFWDIDDGRYGKYMLHVVFPMHWLFFAVDMLAAGTVLWGAVAQRKQGELAIAGTEKATSLTIEDNDEPYRGGRKGVGGKKKGRESLIDTRLRMW